LISQSEEMRTMKKEKEMGSKQHTADVVLPGEVSLL